VSTIKAMRATARVQVQAEAAGQADGADHPDRSAGSDAVNLAAAMDDGTRAQKADALDHPLDDTRWVDAPQSLVTAEEIDQVERHQAERASAECHQDVGAQSERFVPELAIEPQ
jgi:hypothetical protein